MKKRIVALLLVLVMVCSLLPMGALAAGSSITIATPNAASAKLYAAADEAKESDLLSGVEKTENAYTVSLEDGDYTLALFDEQAASLGTIVLTVSSAENSFTVYAVSVTCENQGWVCGTDYTVTPDARSGGAAAPVTRTITLGDGGCSFPCLEGDNVTATIIPTGTEKSAGYASAQATSVVTGAEFAALSGECAPATSLTVTYPYADTNGDGANDFVLEVGTMSNYYVYSYASPVSVSSPSATVTATFMAAKNTAYFYKVSNPLNSDAVSYGNYVTTANKDGNTTVTVTEEQMYVGDSSRNADTVVRDYLSNEYDSGDLYLASNAPDFYSKTGAQGVIRLNTTDNTSCTLYPYRNWLIIEGTDNAKVIEPDFHVEVIKVEGDPITVTENTANNAKKHSYEITANSAGTAVLLVTYDAVTADQAMGKKGKFFSAIRPENTGVLVVTVDGTDDVIANMLSPTAAVNDNKDNHASGGPAVGNSARVAGASFDAELDRLYFYTVDGASYYFTPESGTTVTMAKAVQNGTVSFSAEGVSKEGDTVTLSGIPEGKTIVKLENGDRVSYQVIRATRTNVTVKDAAGNVYYDSASGTRNTNMRFAPRDKVTLTYSKLEHPAQKFSGIYNMNCTVVPYGEGIAVEEGSGYGIYTFNSTPSNWTTTATIPESAEGDSYALTALIRQTGYGSYYGDHRFVAYETGKTANFAAVQQNAWFGGLPAIELLLTNEEYTATFTVTDKTSGATITDAAISVKDGNGNAVPVTNGAFAGLDYKTYSYEITKNGYVSANGTVTFAGENAAVECKLNVYKTPELVGGVYQIGTAVELATFASSVNSGAIAAATDAVLTADIDLTGIAFTPIGNSSHTYAGIFNGQGHDIRNLNINSTAASQGLFGEVGAATIKNLAVYGSVTSTGTGVGGIVGMTKAALKVENCANFASVSGNQNVGGIIGSMSTNARITNCYNVGSITSSNTKNTKCGAGGIAGGGTSKTAKTAITNCYNAGTVTCATNGGAVTASTADECVTNSYYLTGSGSGKGTAQTSDELKALAGTLGNAFVSSDALVNDGYPVLSFQAHAVVAAYDYNAVAAGLEHASRDGRIMEEVVFFRELKNDFTAVDVVAKAFEQSGISNTGIDSGYVSEINGLAAPEGGGYSGWYMSYNNDDFANLGMKQITLTSGDRLEFHYSVNPDTVTDDIGNNWYGLPIVTSLTVAGNTATMSKSVSNGDDYALNVKYRIATQNGRAELTGKGTEAEPFEIPITVSASADLSSLPVSYTTQLGAHYRIVDGLSGQSDFSSPVNFTLSTLGGKGKTYYRIIVTKDTPAGPASGGDDTIRVTFRLIGAEKATQNVDLNTDDYLPKYVTWIPTRSYTLEKNATVYDLFTEALDGAGLTYVGAENNYVSTIYAPAFAGGYALSEFTNGNYSGWMYTVNGSHPNVGLKAKHLSNGDVVVWHYINDYRYEVADWFDGSLGTSGQQNLWLKAADSVPGASDKTNTEQAGDVAPAATAINGEARAEVSSQNIADAIASAKQDGADSIVIAPVIKGDADKIEVELPTEAVRNIVSGTDAALTVQTDMGSLNIPNDTLAEIIKAAGGTNISMNVEQVDVADIQSKLPEGAQTENALAVNFSITSGDKTISSFGGKALEVSFPVDTKVYKESKSYVVYIVSDDGGISRTTAFIKNGEAVVSTTHFSTVVVTKEEAAVFTDIAGHWAYDAILYAYNHELMNGVGDNQFNPGGTLSRAMLVTILYRLEGKPDVTAANPFKDVKNGQWYTDAIIWASEKKLVEGYGSGKFGPDDDITREQMAKILFAYTKLKGYDSSKANSLADYTDVGNISAWALDAVKWANAMNLITGRTATTVVPGGNATRAEAATILMRYMENVVK